jgi:hypothetical protein
MHEYRANHTRVPLIMSDEARANLSGAVVHPRPSSDLVHDFGYAFPDSTRHILSTSFST